MPKALRKRSADEMEQLKQAAMLLRYRTTKPVANNPSYMTYPMTGVHSANLITYAGLRGGG